MKIRPSAPEFLRRGKPDAVAEAETEAIAEAYADVAEEGGQAGVFLSGEPVGDDASPGAEDAIAAESALVEIARSDPHAFAGLYEQHVDRIYAYIYHRVGNVHDAEDLTARTFYRALDRLEQYEDRGLPFSAWLFRIAHNLVANWHRDRQRRRFLSLDRLWWHSHDGDSPERQVESEAQEAALWAAIDRLSEERRNLLLLKFGSEMSNLEIGELLDKSESAVKSLYFRTLASLRKDLEARGWGDGDGAPALEGESDVAGEGVTAEATDAPDSEAEPYEAGR